MARKTVHIPDDLHQRVLTLGALEDSYSGIVQDALEDWADQKEAEHDTQGDDQETPADA